MSEYPRLLGACDLHSKGINEEVKQQILAAFQVLGDDPPSPTRSVDNAADSRFISEAGKVVLLDHHGRRKIIERVSELPFRDVVLQPTGNKRLIDEAITYIKKFTSFVKRTNIVFEGGRFTCPQFIAGTTGDTCTIVADRPCPLYYSASQPALRAATVESLSIPGRSNGRVLVHLDPEAGAIPDIYKQEIVYAGIGQEEAVTESRTCFVTVEYPHEEAVYQLKRTPCLDQSLKFVHAGSRLRCAQKTDILC